MQIRSGKKDLTLIFTVVFYGQPYETA